MRVSYAVVFVSDMSKAVAFYRDVIGLPLKFESPGWSEFSTEGATLALHPGESSPGAGDDTQRNRVGSCRPSLNVPDIDAFHRRMVEKGVRCLQEPKEIFGARIAQYVDPDGMEFSVGQDRAQGGKG